MFLVLLDHWTLSEQQSSAGTIAGGIGVGEKGDATVCAVLQLYIYTRRS